MVDVRRTPWNTIPDKLSFDPELGPWFRQLMGQINELFNRLGGDTDAIENLEVENVDSERRRYRSQRDEIEHLKDQLAQNKRQSRQLEQTVFELTELVSQQKRQSRILEQNLNELIERYDSGT